MGYDFELGRGWNITPKLGLTSWELQGGDLEDVVDGEGELRDAIDGEDVFLDVAVTKHFNSHVGIGFSLQARGSRVRQCELGRLQVRLVVLNQRPILGRNMPVRSR